MFFFLSCNASEPFVVVDPLCRCLIGFASLLVITHIHTERASLARQKQKNKNERTNERTKAQHFQTTSRGYEREPHSSTLELGISQMARLAARQAPNEAPFFVGTPRKNTLSHTGTPPVSALVVVVVPKTPASPAAAAAAAAAA